MLINPLKLRFWDNSPDHIGHMIYFDNWHIDDIDDKYCLSFERIKGIPVGNGGSDRYVPMIWTGWKDRDQKDIYTGDIIKFTASYASDKPLGLMIAAVVLGEYGFELHSPTGYIYDPKTETSGFPTQYELIGHVYKCPDIFQDVRSEFFRKSD